MLKKLIYQNWQSKYRSPAFSQNLLQSIIIGIFFVYIALNMIVLGLVGTEVIQDYFPDQNPLYVVGGFLVYYFLYDLILRVVIQKFPFLDIKKYLTLPIKKSSIAHNLLISSLGSYFNFTVLLFVIPFLLRNGSKLANDGTLYTFILVVIGWTFFNNFCSYLIDRYMRQNSILAYISMGILTLLLYLDFMGHLPLTNGFRKFFDALIQHPTLAILPLAGGILAYFASYFITRNNLYLENMVSQRVTEAKSLQLGFLERYGIAGKLILMEIYLILRNKRPRNMLYISLLFLLYPFIFLDNGEIEIPGLDLFIGMFVTGMFALNYGQLALSWNSTHFDLLATRKISIQDIFEAKYMLLAFSCLVFFLVSLLFGFLNIRLLWLFTVMFFYNVGISIFLYLFLAAHNSKRVDLSKSAMMNYEGLSAGHFIIMIPIMVIPYLIRWPFSAMGHQTLGEAVIGIIGLIGFIFHKSIIRLATKYFKKNRYSIMAAFRKTS